MNTVTKSLIGTGSLVVAADSRGGSDSSEDGTTADLQAEEAMVFTYDFRPRVPFEIVDRLSQPITNSVVSRSPELTDYDEYTGYLVLYRPDTSGEYALVFTKGASFRQGATYRFETNVRVFDTDLGLLTAKVRFVRHAEKPTTEETARTTTTRTTATNETATNETAVNETTANETTANEATTETVTTDTKTTTEGG